MVKSIFERSRNVSIYSVNINGIKRIRFFFITALSKAVFIKSFLEYVGVIVVIVTFGVISGCRGVLNCSYD